MTIQAVEPLVVIDMQGGFNKSFTWGGILDNVVREVELAEQRNDPILLVELSKSIHGQTVDKIKDKIDALKYNSNVFVVPKIFDGGGAEIEECIKQNDISFEALRCCGVNAEFCVRSTVKELKDIYKPEMIIAVKDAIGSKKDGTVTDEEMLKHVGIWVEKYGVVVQ